MFLHELAIQFVDFGVFSRRGVGCTESPQLTLPRLHVMAIDDGMHGQVVR
jgi:hypothetical protein